MNKFGLLSSTVKEYSFVVTIVSLGYLNHEPFPHNKIYERVLMITMNHWVGKAEPLRITKIMMKTKPIRNDEFNNRCWFFDGRVHLVNYSDDRCISYVLSDLWDMLLEETKLIKKWSRGQSSSLQKNLSNVFSYATRLDYHSSVLKIKTL